MSISSKAVRMTAVMLAVAVVALLAVVLGDGGPADGLSTATKIYVG